MSIDLTGIVNKNEYYTNHYFATVFEENAKAVTQRWTAAAKDDEARTPWSLLRQNARSYYAAHDRFSRSSLNLQALNGIRALADEYLSSLGYPQAEPIQITVDETLSVPVYLEMKRSNGAPLLWVVLCASQEEDDGILESTTFDATAVEEDAFGAVPAELLGTLSNEDLATKILFGSTEPPRFLVMIGMNQIALIDRNKWNEKRYLQFDLETIFSRLENSTLQAMAVLLHCESLCPAEGKSLLDELDEASQKNASGVSQNLKYALRESIELLGNEVLYDMAHRLGRDLEADPVNAGQLTLECLRYMYRMLFVLFIESRPELGYTPIKELVYHSGYSLESLRDIADAVRDDVDEVGEGFYLHETLAKLYELIYAGYPKTEAELHRVTGTGSLHDIFLIAPLKAHIFDPEYTAMVTAAKLRNRCMLRIIDLMSLTQSTGKKGDRRGRISYANLGINQMGAVYEALLSYRGFIAAHDLYEVKAAGDEFNELDVGYFVAESDLDQYTEAERVYTTTPEGKKRLRMYHKGAFIYRLAGRERETSASYYTPESLTKCLVKYALKELLEGKTADEILHLTVCEPAMGSAAFLNEAITQLAEAYLTRKEQETGQVIRYEQRFTELQKVKMYIADRNVYGVDLNPTAVELAEVSLWLNTIFEGGFVPWFGTQLVNGNSLIGARRECYRTTELQATSKGLRWYEGVPERAPLSAKKMLPKRVFHFLLGDPGMCSYDDKVIKAMEPARLKMMKAWNKAFTETYSSDEVETLLKLTKIINTLWKAQIKNRELLESRTRSPLSVFGHQDTSGGSITTIREKDRFLRAIYKSEHAQNAGPYARLKFAMDYWCALWFWPISQAELLPSRSEFLYEMDLILVGVMQTQKAAQQMDLFGDEEVDAELEDKEVNLDQLCALFPRLALVRKIAEQNKFMHWELEFADLFAERGGFDFIIGNPPWILMGWNEQSILSDTHPMFAIKKLTATQTTLHRAKALEDATTKQLYFAEYEAMSGTQSFLNAVQNYPELIGMKANLYKCFLPQAWTFGSETGVSAFVHPDGVYDDPQGGLLREQLYPRLRKHFQFTNELKLFAEVDHHTAFSLNVYSNTQNNSFETIGNLFSVAGIEECYDTSITGTLPGIKDENGNWNVHGHPDRIIHVGQEELKLFAKLFDGNDNWKQAHLPVLHIKQYVDVLERFGAQKMILGDMGESFFTTQMWNETNAQKDGTICRHVHFPESATDMIYSGPHIGVANPLFKASRRKCVLNSDYDNLDLSTLPEDYFQRCNYSPACTMDEYLKRVPITGWGTKASEEFRIVVRKMLNQSGERTLIGGIIPPLSVHTNGLLGVHFADQAKMVPMSAYIASIPYDFFIKVIGKPNLCDDTMGKMPFAKSDNEWRLWTRALMLNCVGSIYAPLWKRNFYEHFLADSWTKNDPRLRLDKFHSLREEWTWEMPLRTDYERRQALIEIDVLTAMALGMTLDQLKTIYRIQFPVLQQYEADTWYDANGRIVFTNNRSMVGVGYSRTTWENEVKGAPAGKKFTRTITDDTLPGGPIERTIEYVAPFDRCDREQDYETAWKFFEAKYGK